ncbi:DUF3817 domain-containing protein [Rhizohabitans arisaemae]|uniref:DUF3817 domain-containing protein n=1 Tax=Rhizohabitans arisaemae TaxID=2720610 RepID=UPI0024B0C8D7|nr:DUF3817 domain-containing protein [Rhizohabitans arisaemae]
MESALKLFRVMAYIVGVALLALVVAMVMKYTPIDQPGLVGVVAPAHGFLYVIYLMAALNLSLKARWNWWYSLGVLIAGTIPFVSFYAERKVVQRVQALPAEAV